MEGSASTPFAPHIEAEPVEWQPRALWATARLLSGAVTFFFAAFLFAYAYLRLLDVHHLFRPAAVGPPFGLGIIIALVLVASAVLLRLSVGRPERVVALTAASLTLALLAIVLQAIEWSVLNFGPASGGYASVFIGWTAMYTVFILPCAYWIETQLASAWRARGVDSEQYRELLAASLESCAFLWAYYVAAGVLAFVVLYVI